ncbi:l-fuculose-phosphate aldolase [Phlyctema vagabunda]|uniref:L-fuculose-phosphate aldolase n=1 Tax=Phlyctema vagabunda TaxID=108571 RepID=A0ABR4P6G1_9HELO
MVLCDYDGNIVQGKSKTVNGAGLQIHSAIHKAHPNIHAAVHAHGVNGRAWSAFGRPLDILSQDHCVFYKAHNVYTNFGGVVFDKEEAERLTEALGPDGKGLILQNHGLLTVGQTADEAVYLFCLMERLCDIQLKVEAVHGLKRILVSDEAAEFTKRTAGDPVSS